MKRLTNIILLAGLSPFFACDRGPTEILRTPDLAISAGAAPVFKTCDDELGEPARRLPGFGGVYYLPPGVACTWTANASGGVPPYTSYVWSGVLSGGGSQITGPVWESGWLYVTVTDRAGHPGESSFYIRVDPNAPTPPGCWE